MPLDEFQKRIKISKGHVVYLAFLSRVSPPIGNLSLTTTQQNAYASRAALSATACTSGQWHHNGTTELHKHHIRHVLDAGARRTKTTTAARRAHYTAQHTTWTPPRATRSDTHLPQLALVARRPSLVRIPARPTCLRARAHSARSSPVATSADASVMR